MTIAGNGVVLIYRVVWSREKIFPTAYGLFVTGMAVSDLLMGVYLMIIAVVDVVYADVYVVYDESWRKSFLCHFSGFLSILSSETSTFLIGLITLDRFISISYPFSAHETSTSLYWKGFISTWVIGFVLALIPAVVPEWQIYSSNGLCLALPLDTKESDQLTGWAFFMAVYVILNFILFLFIALGQVGIFVNVIQKRNQPSIRHCSERRIQDMNIAKKLAFVALSDFLCWFPIGIMGIMSLVGEEFHKETYAWMAVFVLPVNSALNPMIYTIPVIVDRAATRRAADRQGSHQTRQPPDRADTTQGRHHTGQTTDRAVTTQGRHQTGPPPDRADTTQCRHQTGQPPEKADTTQGSNQTGQPLHRADTRQDSHKTGADTTKGSQQTSRRKTEQTPDMAANTHRVATTQGSHHTGQTPHRAATIRVDNTQGSHQTRQVPDREHKIGQPQDKADVSQGNHYTGQTPQRAATRQADARQGRRQTEQTPDRAGNTQAVTTQGIHVTEQTPDWTDTRQGSHHTGQTPHMVATRQGRHQTPTGTYRQGRYQTGQPPDRADTRQGRHQTGMAYRKGRHQTPTGTYRQGRYQTGQPPDRADTRQGRHQTGMAYRKGRHQTGQPPDIDGLQTGQPPDRAATC
ncbi:Relaxin receptor 2 [Bulinus truncatus]|nr:Relaxin receptor 2 [Bulinus truncatus]